MNAMTPLEPVIFHENFGHFFQCFARVVVPYAPIMQKFYTSQKMIFTNFIGDFSFQIDLAW